MPRGVYVRTPEIRLRMAEAQRGKTHSPEIRLRMAESMHIVGTWARSLTDKDKEQMVKEIQLDIVDLIERLKTPKKSIAREVCEKHGIDYDELPSQDDQVDIITGRRMSDE